MDDKKMNYPANSHKSREEKNKPEKLDKVVKGVVTTRKKSFGKKFFETFVGDDVNDVGSYILYDLLIPAAKSTLTDIIQSIPEMIFYNGEKRSSRITRDRGRSTINYGGFSASSNRKEDRREVSQRNRARFNFDEIILETRGEAENVLNCLADLTIDYGQATVADLYDLVGVTSNYTDRNYGWRDLGGASTTRSRHGGYMLVLPRTELVD